MNVTEIIKGLLQVIDDEYPYKFCECPPNKERLCAACQARAFLAPRKCESCDVELVSEVGHSIGMLHAVCPKCGECPDCDDGSV